MTLVDFAKIQNFLKPSEKSNNFFSGREMGGPSRRSLLLLSFHQQAARGDVEGVGGPRDALMPQLAASEVAQRQLGARIV